MQKSVVGPCRLWSNAVRAVTYATPRTATLDDISYIFIDDGGKRLRISQILSIFSHYYVYHLLVTAPGWDYVYMPARTPPLERSVPLCSDVLCAYCCCLYFVADSTTRTCSHLFTSRQETHLAKQALFGAMIKMIKMIVRIPVKLSHKV